MIAGDKADGMVGGIAEVFPEADHQRCTAHFHRNTLSKTTQSKRSRVAATPKTINAMESREAAKAKALEVATALDAMGLKGAAKIVRDDCTETMTYVRFPRERWRRMRTNNVIERLDCEIRGRTNIVGTSPDGKSTLMPAAARPKYVAKNEWDPATTWTSLRRVSIRTGRRAYGAVGKCTKT